MGGYLGEVRGHLLRRWWKRRVGSLETVGQITPVNLRVVLGDPGVPQDHGGLGRVYEEQLDIFVMITRDMELEGDCGVSDVADVLAIEGAGQ